MLTALIVDDESLARRLLREFLKPHADIEVIGECDNGFAAVQALTDPDPVRRPDLLFLDIQMPQLSGLEVLALSGREHGVIFTTAYDQYALKAFDLHAVDYLLKPFSQERFDEALAQARKQMQLVSPGLQQVLAEPAPQRLDRILLRERQQVHVLPLDSVLCVEAEDDYIRIHTAERSYLKTQRLSDLQDSLDPARFVRVHRSWLINLDHLRGLERQGKDQLHALLTQGLRVPISRAGHERIKPFIQG
ncbi:LytTR family DNA-binding domain-containing protein [Paucibacter sp. AS339]|uniref:LytR/AlgR family response regulator transcription factor n=1 Tax=Paucibacter hankyongi TaxID=3133434 RepID=UPI003096F60D